MKFNPKIYYSIVAIGFCMFIAITVLRNRTATAKWEQTELFGQINDIALKKNDKGIYMNINNNWYGFSYDRIFEEKSFKMYYLIKYKGEKIFWIKRTPTSTDSVSFWSGASFIVTDTNEIKMIEKGILK
ncbi:MAG: hypothetical protein FD181_1753 [Prolixibacteraceae bacterium]|nr:MAG: hypothetical protein FD181_1753 [Prolixibacteraceae bacterium]